MKGFVNARAYILGKGVVSVNIGVENGKIAYIGDDSSVITEPYPLTDGQVVIAGFIDQHVHGAGGADAIDGTEQALETIANSLATEGTTSFLATTMTQSVECISTALKSVKSYMQKNLKTGAKIVGVHLEGPFISDKHKGAQPLEYIAKHDAKVFDKYFEDSGNSIKIVSLSPESEGAKEFIEHLVSKGVVASAGHTDAKYEDMEKAVSWGLSNVTHTFNAQKGLHHRDVGTVGSALLFDSLNCEAICDTIHLSVPAIKLLIKNKPHDKLTLITDSMRAKHLSDGISDLAGQKVIVKNGEARLEDGTLAGSTLPMNVAIKNLVLKCNVPFTDAVDFATVNPAKNLKMFDTIGSIEVGKNADFAVLDGEFNVHLTVRDGNIIYKK